MTNIALAETWPITISTAMSWTRDTFNSKEVPWRTLVACEYRGDGTVSHSNKTIVTVENTHTRYIDAKSLTDIGTKNHLKKLISGSIKEVIAK